MKARGTAQSVKDAITGERLKYSKSRHAGVIGIFVLGLVLTLVRCQPETSEMTVEVTVPPTQWIEPTATPDDEPTVHYLGGTPQLPTYVEHPHLFFTEDDLAALRAKGEREPYRGWLRDPIQSYAEDVLEKGVQKGTRISSSWVFRRAVYTSFVYQLSGDERYGQAAVDFLMGITGDAQSRTQID